MVKVKLKPNHLTIKMDYETAETLGQFLGYSDTSIEKDMGLTIEQSNWLNDIFYCLDKAGICGQPTFN